MSRYYDYYGGGGSKKSTVLGWIVGILAVLLIASVTLGLGATLGGWFDKVEEDPADDTVLTDDTSTEDSGSDITVDDSTDNDSSAAE